jgi:hypothetical protein
MKKISILRGINIHVIFPLLIGLTLYTLSGRLIFPLNLLLRQPIDYTYRLPNLILFNLPDGLWSYAFMSFIILLWRNDSYKNRWIIVVFMVSLGWELGQKIGFINGTFDWLDCLFILIFNVLSIKILKHESI